MGRRRTSASRQTAFGVPSGAPAEPPKGKLSAMRRTSSNRHFGLSSGRRCTGSRSTTVVSKERCESGRIGLTANELTLETGSEGSNPSLSAGVVSRDIPDDCRETSRTTLGVAAGLVRPTRVDRELADQLTVFGDHPHVPLGHKDQHPEPRMCPPEADVEQLRAVSESHLAALIDPVPPHPVVGRHAEAGPLRCCLRARPEGLRRGAPADRPVRADGVVVDGKAIELLLQLGKARRAGLLRQPALQRLVESLDLPAGLGLTGQSLASCG